MTVASVRVPLGMSREEWTMGSSSHRSQQSSTGGAQRGRWATAQQAGLGSAHTDRHPGGFVLPGGKALQMRS